MIKTEWIFIICIISFMLLGCQSVTSSENQIDSTSLDLRNVTRNVPVVCRLSYVGTFKKRSQANGQLRAPTQSRLSFRIDGTIGKILVHTGSIVENGQLLARLDDRDQHLALRQAQDQVAESLVQLRVLIAEYGGEGLDTVSLKPNVRTFILTKSGYYKAQTTLAYARQQLEYTMLKAPYAGTIANLTAKPFNRITSYEPFCTLLDRSGLVVEFSVLESELPAVRLGMLVQIQPIAPPGYNYNGRVTEINPIVNGQGLILVKAQFNQPDRNLFDGMNARVILEQQLTNRIIIPKSAVVERSGRKVVFTAEDGRAKWHYVTIMHENDTEVAIGNGLKAGEQVIVSGNLNLGHDAPLTILQP